MEEITLIQEVPCMELFQGLGQIHIVPYSEQ